MRDPVQKICFFGLRSAFDHGQIGGTESYFRRLANCLATRGIAVDYVMYGADRSRIVELSENVILHYSTSFTEALKTLDDGHHHVVCVHIEPRHRLAFMRWRLRRCRDVLAHPCLFGHRESAIRQYAKLAETRLLSFNGCCIAVSPRLFKLAGRMRLNPVLLLPPVDEAYFLAEEEKSLDDPLQVTYIGRTDPGKGIDDVFDVFNSLGGQQGIKCRVAGLHWQHDRGTVAAHERMKSQESFLYETIEHTGYSPEAENNVRRLLRDTDILLLPYRRLSSTVDMPLLLLEGMASLCAVVTRRLGDIPLVYGESPFLIEGPDFVNKARAVILSARDKLASERQRLVFQRERWRFSTAAVAERMLAALSSGCAG